MLFYNTLDKGDGLLEISSMISSNYDARNQGQFSLNCVCGAQIEREKKTVNEVIAHG